MLCFFLFFKQKTAYEMRISDWSSDVCSSDLSNASLAITQRASAASCAATILPRRCDNSLIVRFLYSLAALCGSNIARSMADRTSSYFARSASASETTFLIFAAASRAEAVALRSSFQTIGAAHDGHPTTNAD